MTISDVINNFNTTPFLFVGSGMSMRYLSLPTWKRLLEHFAKEINNDPFAYSAYESRAKSLECRAGLLPKIAELIQRDYDEKWFSCSDIRTVDETTMDLIKDGLSPFKAEVSAFITRNSHINTALQEEIDKLGEISEKSISGIITTNYDSFLEDIFRGYTKYIGQTELIFSAIQGVAEIYKIHGSIEDPQSIVINEDDYVLFEEKSSYLAAKLMTIFMEYPIIFMGYSISDSNVQNIIKCIVNCLDEAQVKCLENRFIFVEYKEDSVGATVSPFTIMVDNKALNMTKITLSDFLPLYTAIGNKKAKLPVRILRRFKQELYDYTIVNTPTANLRVASIDDSRVADEDLVLAIGKMSDFGLRGLSGITGNEWYRDIVLDDIEFTPDELLEFAFPNLIKQNSNRLPINKHISLATKSFPLCEDLAKKQTFEQIVSDSIRNNRKCLGAYQSPNQIWHAEKNSLERATRLLAHLPEEKFVLSELEAILRELFENDVNILDNVSPNIRTNIRRLILIYDYLKWGKK